MKNLEKLNAKEIRNTKQVKGGTNDNGATDIVNPLANEAFPTSLADIED